MLAHVDGAAWVRAALVRDLVCRTGCSTCLAACCWAVICSACASITRLVLQNQGFPLVCQEASSSLPPAPVSQPVPLAAAAAAAAAAAGAGGGGGREEAGRSLVAHDLQRPKKICLHLSRTTPQGQIRYIIKLPAVTPQGKNNIYAGCYWKGTVYLCVTPFILMPAVSPLKERDRLVKFTSIPAGKHIIRKQVNIHTC